MPVNTYRVDFSPASLRSQRGARTRLMRDVKKIVGKMKKDLEQPPRYLWKRRTDGSLGYWFQLSGEIKDKKAVEMLKPYGWTASSPPILPESEWKRL